MGLFGRKKNSDTKKDINITDKSIYKVGGDLLEVKILGSGCAKCNALEEAVCDAVSELGIETVIDHITDFAQIAAYGVMMTPALVVDGKVVSYGKVLKKDEVKKLLKEIK